MEKTDNTENMNQMEWKTWYRHGDGTPRTLYLTIQGKTELFLNDEFERCALRIKLESGTVRLEKEFYLNDKAARAAEAEIQEWAVKTAISWLMELESLAGRTWQKLSLFGRQDDTEKPKD